MSGRTGIAIKIHEAGTTRKETMHMSKKNKPSLALAATCLALGFGGCLGTGPSEEALHPQRSADEIGVFGGWDEPVQEQFEAVLATNNAPAPGVLSVLYGPYADDDPPANGVTAAVIKPVGSDATDRGGEWVWAGTVGFSHDGSDGPEPLTVDMVVDLASVSKPITAAMIARHYGTEISLGGNEPTIVFSPETTLNDLMPLFNTTFFAGHPRAFGPVAGYCNAATPVSTFVPEGAEVIPNVCGSITIGQLLDHTSGVGWLPEEPLTSKARPIRAGTPNATTGPVTDVVIDWGRPSGPGITRLTGLGEPKFSPGEPPAGPDPYSNDGYEILGLVLVALEGKPVDQLLAETMASLDSLRDDPSARISRIYAEYADIPADVPLAHGWSPIDGKRIHCEPRGPGLAIATQSLKCVETKFRHNNLGNPYKAGFPNTNTQLSDGYHLIPGSGIRQREKWFLYNLTAGSTATCFFYWRFWLGQAPYSVCYDQSFFGQKGMAHGEPDDMVHGGYDDITKEMEYLNPRSEEPKRPYAEGDADWNELRNAPVEAAGGMYGTPTDVAKLFQETFWYDDLLGAIDAEHRQALAAVHLLDETEDPLASHQVGCRELVGKGGVHSTTSTYVVMDVDTGITAAAFHNSAPVSDFGFTVSGGLDTLSWHGPNDITKRIAFDLLAVALEEELGGEICG